MKLRELKRFRRTTWNEVPADVVRQLGIPAPDDVLEQFVIDHGLKGHIQRQFGDLDIHRLRWEQVPSAVPELRAATVDSYCQRLVDDCAREAKSSGLEPIGSRYRNTPEVLSSWKERGTWSLAPLALAGSPLRWIEGHTRLGYLRGLADAGVVASSSLHLVWIGREDATLPSNEVWRDVLGREHISFGEWLMCAQGEPTPRGTLGDDLVAAKYAHPPHRFDNNLDGVTSIVGRSAALIEVHTEWQLVVGGH